ncbi:MAG: cytochrome-c peroxidase [Verrucomicrobiales bacterium]|nr:cytochrome-c peroxidase [Verrucomicrobiales bacterium]
MPFGGFRDLLTESCSFGIILNSPTKHSMKVPMKEKITLFLVLISSLCISRAADPASVEALREILAEHDVKPLDPKPEVSPDKIKLGQALFFDPLIGGNQDVSCATCHHPLKSTTDGRSRSVGTRAYVNMGRRMPEGLRLVEVEGRDPVMMGFNMNSAAHPFTPRNAPDAFNRGDSEWHTMFWDSRAFKREDGRFVVNQMRLTKTPGYYQVVMPEEIENVLAAQAMMPVTSDAEMRGTKGETGITGAHNEVGAVLKMNEEEIWAKLMVRLLAIDEYREMFQAAYPDKKLEDLHFAHAANAIAAFEIDAFTFHDSPFDRFLAGDDTALNEQELRGAHLFYGKANCASCHTGKLLTDQKPHNIGVVPIGPGPQASEDYDFGVTHRSDFGLEDRFAFRTPPLRNVELTGPYMHNGAYTTLEGAVRHQLNPAQELENYDTSQLEPEFRGAVHTDKEVIKMVKKTMPEELKLPKHYSDQEVEDLVVFLKSLTSPSSRDLSSAIPESVPSGLEMVLPFPQDD